MGEKKVTVHINKHFIVYVHNKMFIVCVCWMWPSSSLSHLIISFILQATAVFRHKLFTPLSTRLYIHLQGSVLWPTPTILAWVFSQVVFCLSVSQVHIHLPVLLPRPSHQHVYKLQLWNTVCLAFADNPSRSRSLDIPAHSPNHLYKKPTINIFYLWKRFFVCCPSVSVCVRLGP